MVRSPFRSGTEKDPELSESSPLQQQRSHSRITAHSVVFCRGARYRPPARPTQFGFRGSDEFAWLSGSKLVLALDGGHAERPGVPATQGSDGIFQSFASVANSACCEDGENCILRATVELFASLMELINESHTITTQFRPEFQVRGA